MPIWGWRMIDFGVRKLCATPVYAVCIWVGLAAVAQADAWDDFLRVCLAPAEAFEAYRTDLPDAASDWVELVEGEAAFALADAGQFVVIEALPVDGRRACRVHDQLSSEVAAAFRNWMDIEGERGRYIADPFVTIEDGVAVMSHEIFEPVLSVQMWRDGAGVVVRILETSRES